MCVCEREREIDRERERERERERGAVLHLDLERRVILDVLRVEG